MHMPHHRDTVPSGNLHNIPASPCFFNMYLGHIGPRGLQGCFFFFFLNDLYITYFFYCLYDVLINILFCVWTHLMEIVLIFQEGLYCDLSRHDWCLQCSAVNVLSRLVSKSNIANCLQSQASLQPQSHYIWSMQKFLSITLCNIFKKNKKKT